MMEETRQYKRHTAVKISVRDLLRGEFVEQETGSHVATGKGAVSRVNLLGFVVNHNQGETMSSFLVDDGTGKIDVRSWEGYGEGIGVGDLVLLVGRPRLYQNSTYVAVEIMRKIGNSDWLKLRRLELGEFDEKAGSPAEKVLSLIKEMDSGDGVGIEALQEKVENVDPVLNSLLSNGDVFEVRPGVVKILE